jgi:hypothetical protein
MPRKKRTLAERQQAVKSAWDLLEGHDPDISSEMLLARVAEETDEDQGDVAALHEGEDPARL